MKDYKCFDRVLVLCLDDVCDMLKIGIEVVFRNGISKERIVQNRC